MRPLRLTCLLLPLFAIACTDEQPLGLGSELLPPQTLRSFEVVLEPDRFLLSDTSFALYGETRNAAFMLLASDYGGALNSHGFARFDMPVAIAVTDTLDVSRVDSTFVPVRGEVRLLVDSTADNTDSIFVAMHSFAESWDPDTADWDDREGGVPWSTPGGTQGVLIDTAMVAGDTIVLEVDSATMQAWADTTNGRRGALLSVQAGPGRVRLSAPSLVVYSRSSYKPDTLFTTVSQAPLARFDYRPALPIESSDPWIAGLPLRRSFLHFRPDIDTITVPCGTGCTIPLRSASITRAELVLQPVAAPAGFTPELPLQPTSYPLLRSPEFPLERSPLGDPVGTVLGTVEPSRFADGTAPVYLIVTEFVARVVADSTSSTQRSDWLAVLPNAVPTVGVGTFAPSPRLRLLLTIAREIQLP